jgi:hypothetical protein
MKKLVLVSTLSVISVLAAIGSPAIAGEPIDPANFVVKIDNPWHPLVPGTVMTYTGTLEDKPATEVITVTSKTKSINGVACVVVEIVQSLAGVAADRTLGYFAQDKDGNVWTFGEDVQELNAKGKVVKNEGWHAGIDGAAPSIVMEAMPAKGHTLVNEYTNDHSEVSSLTKVVKVPFGSFKDALVTKEWTPDEPDVLMNKYFVRDIGMVRDVSVKGDTEEFQLVDVKK